jgi:hypothetical protein
MHPQKERKSLHALFSSADNYGNETFSYKLLFSSQEKKRFSHKNIIQRKYLDCMKILFQNIITFS